MSQQRYPAWLKTMQQHPIIPVVTLADATDAQPTANALTEGGINIIEITLRTPAGLQSITNTRKHTPSMLVGAGTVRSSAMADAAVQAGAEFLVSPSWNTSLIEWADTHPTIPIMLGTATPHDMMSLEDLGFGLVKFFPAELMGGTEMLSQAGKLCSNLQFCPTGGLTAGNAAHYLSLPNVTCIGGSWIASKSLIADKNWASIAKNASQACNIK